MLDVYTEFVEWYMALPVIKGVKIASERFVGADTYCIEALRMVARHGTSHFQMYRKAFDVKFDKDKSILYVIPASISTA